MKSVLFIAGMTIFGAIAGTGYAEYKRVQTVENTARAYVFHLTEAYKKDAENTLRAVTTGVKICAAENYSGEFPPVLTAFMTETLATDYQLVEKYGIGAEHHTDKLTDMRNTVSNKFYDAINTELETLAPEAERRVLQMMRTFRTDRKTIVRCINEKAYGALQNQTPA